MRGIICLWTTLVVVIVAVAVLSNNIIVCHGLVVHPNNNNNNRPSRRVALEWLVQSTTSATGVATAAVLLNTPFLPASSAWAATVEGSGKTVRQERLVDEFDIDKYLKTGFVNNPMGVSGQAGKSRPETGVVLRDGSEASQDGTGNVLAEILLKNNNGQTLPFLATFSSPWPLATGTVFDVECRDGKSGDGTFLAVTSRINGGDSSNIPDSFYVDQLFARTGRFSFYGEPTDVKVKQAYTRDDGYRVLDVAFSILSQATQTEIPHRAQVVATVPNGADQAVMLVSSSLTSRWKNKKTADAIRASVESFRAIPAPQTSLKLRGKPRRNDA